MSNSPTPAPAGTGTATETGCAKCAAVIAAMQELAKWPDLPGVQFGVERTAGGEVRPVVIRPEQVEGIYEAILRHVNTLLPFGRDAVKALHDRATLTRQLAEAQQDTARLDWLERRRLALNDYYRTDYGWRFVSNHNVTRLFVRDVNTLDLNDAEARAGSIREAIDAARIPTTPDREG